MSKYLFTLFITVLTVCYSKAQDCKNLLFEQGATYEMEHYDSKSKKTGITKSNVKEVTESGGKKTATVHSEIYDSKDKIEEQTDFKMVCEGGKIMIDLSPLASKINNQAEGMEIKTEAAFVEIPADLSVGQTLPEGKMVMRMIDKNSGQEVATTTVLITDRKVEGKESVVTPAGTFDTWKINSTIKMETVMSMGMKVPGGVNAKNVEYFNKEVGVVKSEQLNKKGEVESSSVLIKYSKP